MMYRGNALLGRTLAVRVVLLLCCPVPHAGQRGPGRVPLIHRRLEHSPKRFGGDLYTHHPRHHHLPDVGFGGGTNAAGSVISPGGFGPLIVLFSGSGPTATIVTDGSGDVLADADNLNNPPFSPIGNCPPAGTST